MTHREQNIVIIGILVNSFFTKRVVSKIIRSAYLLLTKMRWETLA